MQWWCRAGRMGGGGQGGRGLQLKANLDSRHRKAAPLTTANLPHLTGIYRGRSPNLFCFTTSKVLSPFLSVLLHPCFLSFLVTRHSSSAFTLSMPRKRSTHRFQRPSSVQSRRTPFCDPMDCSTPGFPVHHQLPELAQTHVHRVGDAI